MMLRAVACWLMAIGACYATTIAETAIVGPSGDLAVGKITLTATGAFNAASGRRVETLAKIVTVRAGAFSVVLEPNDTASPAGTSYRAEWQLDGAAPRVEYWVVPTSSATLRVAAVTGSRVSPAVAVAPGQLSRGGGTNGDCLVLSDAGWVPTVCGVIRKPWSGLTGVSWRDLK